MVHWVGAFSLSISKSSGNVLVFADDSIKSNNTMGHMAPSTRVDSVCPSSVNVRRTSKNQQQHKRAAAKSNQSQEQEEVEAAAGKQPP